MCLLSTSATRSSPGYMIGNGYLHVAWCGDTQCVVVKQNGRVSFVSSAHKPNGELEKRRIEANGGSVAFQSSAWRVNGSLAVARAFGDVDYQAFGVTSEPDVRSLALDGTEDFVVIGCDGLWEGLVGEDVAVSTSGAHDWLDWLYSELQQSSGSVNPAELLVRRAKENGSSDNITAVFVCLRETLGHISSRPTSHQADSDILHL